MTNKVALITNGYYTSKASEYQRIRLEEELTLLGIEMCSIKNNEANLLGDRYQFNKAIFEDKDIFLAKNLESANVRCYNSSQAIYTADSKILTGIALAGVVDMPITLSVPKHYQSLDIYQIVELLKKADNILGYPMVIKKDSSSLGKDVYLALNQEEAIAIIMRLGDCEILLQQFIKESQGRSIRVYATKNKILGAILLNNTKDFRSNGHLGGIAANTNISEKHSFDVLAIMEKLNLDFAGIDFFDTSNPLLIEVNSNAYFQHLESMTNLNIAKEIVKTVVEGQ